ncbi:MAG: hypothetical protein R3C27_06265 [Hyphomonadaceae bacterium]
MLTCLALVAFNVTALGDISKMSTDIEAEARALAAVETITPSLLSRLEAFSSDAQQFSISLRNADVGQDMPCIFQGIANDAMERAGEFAAADTPEEQDAAFMHLRVLMDDTAMLAPLAAVAAADRAEGRDAALR